MARYGTIGRIGKNESKTGVLTDNGRHSIAWTWRTCT